VLAEDKKMKKSNKKSTQTDGSSGVKMSVEDQAEISRHIDIKKRIGELEDTLHELRQRTKSFDPDDVPCAIDMQICRIEQTIDKEYAKIGISMTDLPEKQKEAWK
jgi:ribosomal protein RSM22 (predicted rRNA methylase)